MKKLRGMLLILGLMLFVCGCGKSEDDADELASLLKHEHSVMNGTEQEDGTNAEAVLDEEGYLVVNDTVYVTSNTLNLRKEPSAEAELVTTVTYGTAIARTGIGENGWCRLFYEEQTVYASANYLTAVTIGEEQEFSFSPAMLSIVETSRQIYSYQTMSENLAQLREKYSDCMKLGVLGVSADNRNIYEVTIGNPAAKRNLYIVAGTTACEYMSTLVCMKQLEYYLCYYETGNYRGFSYQDLFDNVAIHVIPMANPDGIMISEEYLADMKNDEIAGRLKEWFERDQDGGGTNLNLESYLMFFRANTNGVEINKNFAYQWDLAESTEEPGAKGYKGKEAESEVEVQAMLAQLGRKEADLVISYHTSGASVCYQYGQAEPRLTQTKQYAQYLASIMNYEVDETLIGLEGYGSYEGYCNMVAGIPALRVNLGTGEAPLSLNEFDAIWNACRESWAAAQVQLIDY